ncbi:MAG: PEP-CTERM sorting domain-containing protein [Armatimonadota bacterium]
MNKSLKSAVAAITILISIAGSVGAAVNLELRPANVTGAIGDTLTFDLYAVSTGPDNDLVSAMDVILTWDPTYLVPAGDFDGLGSATDGVLWEFDGLLFQSSGINARDTDTNKLINDGNFLWTLAAITGEPVSIPTDGLKLVDFIFDAAAETPGTPVAMVTTLMTENTQVFSGVEADMDIKGSLNSVNATIVPEPTGLLAMATGMISLFGLLRRRSL